MSWLTNACLHSNQSLLPPACTVNARAQASCLNADAVERLYDLGGVRIEDNVLVKPGGHFNLTMAAGLPKEAADIEAAMAASRR